MSIGSGMIPETYVITILNSSTFEYYKEGYKNEKQTYTKVEGQKLDEVKFP